jgi:hypothetical protein
VRVPVGIDPGFDYAPGRSLGDGRQPPDVPRTPPSLVGQVERATQTVIEKTMDLPASVAAHTTEQVLALDRATAAMDAGFAHWMRDVVQEAKPRNRSYIVGALTGELVEQLAARQIEPMTAAILVRDAELLHALRDAKVAASVQTPRALTPTELERLPSMIRSPRAVLLELARNRLLYVVGAQRREAAKVAIAIDYRIKTEEGREVVNSFRTAGLVDLADLRGEIKAGRLVLLRGPPQPFPLETTAQLEEA